MNHADKFVDIILYFEAVDHVFCFGCQPKCFDIIFLVVFIKKKEMLILKLFLTIVFFVRPNTTLKL
jgi:hypothetical protein